MSDAPTIRIDLASPVPAYRQIADGIRALLLNGAFATGDLLPTVRQLAADLGVHHNTVAEAYRTLSEEGWLELARGRGAQVVERSHPKLARQAQETFLRRLRELVAEARAAGVAPDALHAVLVELARGLAPDAGRNS